MMCRETPFKSLFAVLLLCGHVLLASCGGRAVSFDVPPDDNIPAAPHAEAVYLDHARELVAKEPLQNYVSLLENGHEALLLRIHLIRSARKNISIQTLIWANDEAGRLYMYELIQAAKRGVKVRFLIDHLSSERHLEFATYLASADPHFEIRLFNPVSNLLNQPKANSFLLEKFYSLIFKFHRFNHRMHNKSFIVDDLVAITGGRNYQNAYYDLASGMNYKDRDIVAVGPVVEQVATSFEEYWHSKYAVNIAELSDVKKELKDRQYTYPHAIEDYLLNGIYEQVSQQLLDKDLVATSFIEPLQPVERAYYISDSPGKRERILLWLGKDSRITRELAKVVSSAEEKIYIQTPYLILTSSAISLFKDIRKEHPDIDIRISTNSLAATDSWHVYALSYKQKQTYLQSLKFKIYEFMPVPGDMQQFMPELGKLEDSIHQHNLIRQMQGDEDEKAEPYLCLHGKSLVVDNRISFVGSYNLDPRSENLNTEAGLFIEDQEFARLLSKNIVKDMSANNSWVIARKKRPLGLSVPNAILAKLSDLIPLVDIWPFRYSAAYELLEGREAVDPEHPDFYENYKDVGSFPQIDADNFGKEIGARGTKAFLGFVKPLL